MSKAVSQEIFELMGFIVTSNRFDLDLWNNLWETIVQGKTVTEEKPEITSLLINLKIYMCAIQNIH